MSCPKCKGDLTSSDKECASSVNKMTPEPSTNTKSTSVHASGCNNNSKTMVYSVVVIIFLLSFYAAHSISEAGTAISQIRSVGGSTMEEIYYLELGGIYEGFANMARAAGVFFCSLIMIISNKK